MSMCVRVSVHHEVVRNQTELDATNACHRSLPLSVYVLVGHLCMRMMKMCLLATRSYETIEPSTHHFSHSRTLMT